MGSRHKARAIEWGTFKFYLAHPPSSFSPAPLTFAVTLYCGNTKNANILKEWDMSKNHYSTKPKRRNRSGKRKDTRRIAENMAKIKELERSSAPIK